MDSTDQNNPAILPSSSHSLRETSGHHLHTSSERYHASPNVHSLASRSSQNVVPSPPEMNMYPERSKRTETSGRGLERTGMREQVDDLEASIDVIDGLVTSLSDFAMRTKVQ